MDLVVVAIVVLFIAALTGRLVGVLNRADRKIARLWTRGRED